VIIVRLPFPIRTALLEDKKEKYPHLEMFLDDYCVPNMLIKLRQGGGRLIRTETDTGVLSILDARASSRGRYRQSVLEAFKKYPLVNSIEEVEKHMKRVKDKSYFEEVADGSEKKK
jgi:ATP-dependent DNA helicase DinG